MLPINMYLKYSVPKKIPIVFDDGYDYDYHFIVKRLAEYFKKQFTCLGESIEKDITSSFSIKKEITVINKN